MNKSEEFTYKLCKESFLSLWSYATPNLQNGKEFCDVLVVFGDQIVIFSVKEIKLADRAEELVAFQRWRREAIEKSVKQIYNAQRWITMGMGIYSNKIPIKTPHAENLRIHRVAVALGSKGKVNIESRDFGRGFVHVLDEDSTFLLLRELNTITDFVDYLNAVESFLLRSSGGIMLQGGDEDLLGLYLLNNRTFPKADVLLVGDDVWRGFEERDEVKKRREAEKVSHLWDGLIETLAQHEKERTWEYSLNGKEAESALRTMARENRYNRRILSQNLDDVLRTTPNGATRGRLVESPSGVAYVILATRKGRDRDERRAELYWRCFVARDIVPGVTTVVGIATETYNPKDPGFSFDVCQLEFQDWTLEQRKQAQELREKNGWFPQDKQKRLQVDEYPQ